MSINQTPVSRNSQCWAKPSSLIIFINYCRLSAYFLPFKNRDGSYKKETVYIYKDDKHLEIDKQGGDAHFDNLNNRFSKEVENRLPEVFILRG